MGVDQRGLPRMNAASRRPFKTPAELVCEVASSNSTSAFGNRRRHVPSRSARNPFARDAMGLKVRRSGATRIYRRAPQSDDNVL